MKKIVSLLLCLAVLGLGSVSCKKDDPSESVKSTVNGDPDAKTSSVSDTTEATTTETTADTDEDLPSGQVRINEENFPDSGFREYVSEFCDKNGDGILDEDEIRNVEEMTLNYNDHSGEMASIKGIEYFTSLKSLDYFGPGPRKEALLDLDLSHNTELTKLDISGGGFAKLDLSHNVNLVEAWITLSPISELDVSGCPNLETLSCRDTGMRSLDLSHNPKLVMLDCTFGEYAPDSLTPSLQALDLSVCPNLQYLFVAGCPLEALDLSACPELLRVDADNCPIGNLDLSRNTKLQYLDCSGCGLSSLDVSMCPDMVEMRCSDNQLTELDLSGNSKLEKIYCSGNQMTKLDVTDNHAIVVIECANNLLTEILFPTESASEFGYDIDFSYNQLQSLDISGEKIYALSCKGNPITSLSLGENELLIRLDVRDTALTSVDVRKCPIMVEAMRDGSPKEVTFNDETFYSAVSDRGALYYYEGTEIVWQ